MVVLLWRWSRTDPDSCGRGSLTTFGQLAHQAVELKLPEKVGHTASVVVARETLVQVEFNRRLGNDGGQLPALSGGGLVFPKDFLRLRWGNFINMSIDIVDAAELLDELGRRFFPDTANTGNVV